MNFLHCLGAFCASTAFWCVATNADKPANLNSPEDRYDLRRLMQPTAAELAFEEKGGIHIYDSVEVNEVNAALDEKFERIHNRMFTHILHLPPPGAGHEEEPEVEDDGRD